MWSNIESEPMSAERAGFLIVQTMQSPLYGWTLPTLNKLLQDAHIHVQQDSEQVNCTWTYHPDINRWICLHKHSLLNLPMVHMLGSLRN